MVEMLVALLIFSIVISMTYMVMSNTISFTASSTRLGVSAESAQVEVSDLAQFISSAILPAAACDAAGSSCTSWPCSDTDADGLAAEQSESSADGDESAIENSGSTSLAKPFSLTFCGYPIGGSGPAQSYSVGVTGCAGGSSPGAFCTLQVKNLTISKVVASIPKVWCDSACQADGTPAPGGTPAFFTYYDADGLQSLEADTTAENANGALTPPVAASTSSSIQAIGLDVTVLANSNPNLPVSANGQPGTTIKQQIWLSNVANGE